LEGFCFAALEVVDRLAFVQNTNNTPINLQLRRDLVRIIKRGHAWVYADALRDKPDAPPGSHAILHDNRGGREIARGFYDPKGAISLRIASTERGKPLDDRWAEMGMVAAMAIRAQLFDQRTTAYRLFNGEGDGLPGLVCDIFGRAAVLMADGPAARAFWDLQGIAAWLADKLALQCVYERFREQSRGRGQALIGDPPTSPVHFFENGLQFTANLVDGQKTGFFLDQRENRQRIVPFSMGARVLNVFGYTGGFSVFAGMGGAQHVTTVDRAKPALEAAEEHWRLNKLAPDIHTTIAAEAFEWLHDAVRRDEQWDLVILDPPSFAASKKVLPQAHKAYRTLIAAGAKVTAPGGRLAISSCSSHVDRQTFLGLCEDGISQAHLWARIFGMFGQPGDHPAPLVMPELQYLKFAILQLF